MKNNILIAVIVIALAAAGIWYVNTQSASSGNTQMSPSETPGTEASGTSEMMQGEAREVLVEGTEFKFVPSTLTFKKGERIKLVFKNTGEMTHDWVVDELNVRTTIIKGGSEETIEFTPDKAGTFEYYCSVGKHRENGMVGTLTVTE